MPRMNAVAVAKPDALILREKDINVGFYETLARIGIGSCRANGVKFVVHTFFSAAKKLGVEDVQLPMEVYRNFPKDLKGLNTGASIHNLEELEEAVAAGAKWVIFGNVFETACKPGKPAEGVDMLKRICDASPVPVYAIGGVTPQNARLCKEAGAAGVCAMGPFMTCPDPSELVRQFREALKD